MVNRLIHSSPGISSKADHKHRLKLELESRAFDFRDPDFSVFIPHAIIGQRHRAPLYEWTTIPQTLDD
jgi:hypothetical protein